MPTAEMWFSSNVRTVILFGKLFHVQLLVLIAVSNATNGRTRPRTFAGQTITVESDGLADAAGAPRPVAPTRQRPTSAIHFAIAPPSLQMRRGYVISSRQLESGRTTGRPGAGQPQALCRPSSVSAPLARPRTAGVRRFSVRALEMMDLTPSVE
jgi:hypothetical protein